MRNLRFLWLLLKLRLSHLMVFRLSFFGAFLADGMLFAVQLLAFSVIYGQVDAIGGFNRGQMMIFVGTFSMINGLNMLIYFFGIVGIPQMIREGGLDLYITKPGSALLRLTFERVDPGSLPLLLLSGVIIAAGVRAAGVTMTAGLVLGYAGLVALMALLWYDMEVILRTFPFFFISASQVMRLEGTLLSTNFKVPGVLYKGVWKAVFYFILPYGIMATVPTQYITRALSLGGLAHAVGIVVVFTAFTLWFWRFGLRHYKSASS
jgi:ABC-2 type transport system permease protein